MQMTDEEIRRDFQLAKNPLKQIKILAELNDCSIDKIKYILGVKEMKSNYTVWSKEKDQQLYELKKAGNKWSDIAKVFETSAKAVQMRYYKIRDRFAELNAEPTPVEAESEHRVDEFVAKTDKNSFISDMYKRVMKLANMVGINVCRVEINQFNDSWHASAAGIENTGSRITIELTCDPTCDMKVTES
jgi:hypothetical protein